MLYQSRVVSTLTTRDWIYVLQSLLSLLSREPCFAERKAVGFLPRLWMRVLCTLQRTHSILRQAINRSRRWMFGIILSRPKAGWDLRLSMGVDGYMFQWICTQICTEKCSKQEHHTFQWICTQICTEKSCAILYGGRWIYVPVNLYSNLHWKV